MTKKYFVTFRETYVYSREIEIQDDENIEEVIKDPLTNPMIHFMSDEEYNSSNIAVANQYEIWEYKGDRIDLPSVRIIYSGDEER